MNLLLVDNIPDDKVTCNRVGQQHTAVWNALQSSIWSFGFDARSFGELD